MRRAIMNCSVSRASEWQRSLRRSLQETDEPKSEIRGCSEGSIGFEIRVSIQRLARGYQKRNKSEDRTDRAKMGVPAKPLLAGSPGVLQSFQSYGRGRVSMESWAGSHGVGPFETGWPPIAAFSTAKGGDG